MKRVYVGLALALAVLGAIVGLRADDASQEEALRARMVGTWRMAAAKFGGRESELLQRAVTYKHVTPAGFVWLSHDKDTGKVFRAAGGTYTLRGSTYTETIQYGLGDDFEVIKRSSPAFTCRIEGDKWYHTGELANGVTVDEIWQRVKPAPTSSAR